MMLKEILMQYWFIPVLLLAVLIALVILFFVYRNDDVMKKYGFLFFLAFAVIVVFFIIKLFSKAAAKSGDTLPAKDIRELMDNLKKIIANSGFARAKAAEKIGDEMKLKSDLEAKIESIFGRYSHP